MVFADDAIEALGGITHAIAEGTIAPGEGAALATLHTRAIDVADLIKRVDKLEAKTKGGNDSMSQARRWQIARLEKLAGPMIECVRQAEEAVKARIGDTAISHAVGLGF